MAGQEKESKSGIGKDNRIMIFWGKDRKYEPSLRLWKVGDCSILHLDIESVKEDPYTFLG